MQDALNVQARGIYDVTDLQDASADSRRGA
jgi:hypothetical protein